MGITLSVCYIVKDEEEMLRKTLPSVSAVADELIIVDTGSTDRTIEVAKSFGAKIYEFPWKNDFAAARNRALENVSSDWILFLDADEFVPLESMKKLKAELALSKASAHQLIMWQAKPDTIEKQTSFYRTRVFRNYKGYYFSRPVNEQLVDVEKRLVCGPALKDIEVYHWGYHLPKDKMEKKQRRNIALLAENLKHPYYAKDAAMHYLLASNLKDIGLFAEALVEFDQAIALTADRSMKNIATIRKGWCLLNLRKLNEALACAREILSADEKSVEAMNLGASVLLSVGMFDEAIFVLRKSQEVSIPENPGFFLDTAQYTTLPNYLLAKAYMNKGELDDSLLYLEKAYQHSKEEAIKNDLETVRAKIKGAN